MSDTTRLTTPRTLAELILSKRIAGDTTPPHVIAAQATDLGLLPYTTTPTTKPT